MSNIHEKRSTAGEIFLRADHLANPPPIVGSRKKHGKSSSLQIKTVKGSAEGGITAGQSSSKPRSLTNPQDTGVTTFPAFVGDIGSNNSPALALINPKNSQALVLTSAVASSPSSIVIAKPFGDVLNKSKNLEAFHYQLSEFNLNFDRTPTQTTFDSENILQSKISRLSQFLEVSSITATQASISEPTTASTENSAQDSLRTPTQATFNSSQELQLSPLSRPNDSEVTAGKLVGIMARVDDAFDVEEWARPEVQADIDDSPEILTVTPQPVTYTTVGSLKPLLNPHFAPPNRIQREGALRRAPPAPVQIRGHDSHLGVHGATQQYNKSYGSSNQSQYGLSGQSHYGPSGQSPSGTSSQPQYGPPGQSHYGPSSQPSSGLSVQSQYKPLNQSQYEPSSMSQYGTTAQSQSGQTSNTKNLVVPSSMTISDLEKNVLEKLGLSDLYTASNVPSTRSGNIPPTPRGVMLRTDPSLNPKAEAFNILNQPKADTPDQGSSASNSLPKIDKMQTLLSISQYPNPMQQSAKDRLSGFAAAKSQNVARPTLAQVTQQSEMLPTASYVQIPASTNMHNNLNYEEQEKGDFSHNYRFPPPGLARPTQPNPLATGYGQQRVSESKLSTEKFFTDQQQQMRSGRPQPLTAGPPGQRQNASYNAAGTNSQPGGPPGNSQLPYHQLPPTLPSNSPWQHLYQMNQFSHSSEHGKIRNTLPLSSVAQCYPNGLPADMTGDYTPLSPIELQKYSRMTTEPPMTEEEIGRKKQDKWWYSGVRKFNKTVEGQLHELETRQLQRNQGLEPQRPASPPPISENKILSIKDLQEMSEPDVTEPLLGAVFGSLLGYADQVITPNHKGTMSRFAPVPAWAIDFNERGNESFFGEDWGQPPKRHGRDPRFQPFE